MAFKVPDDKKRGLSSLGSSRAMQQVCKVCACDVPRAADEYAEERGIQERA